MEQITRNHKEQTIQFRATSVFENRLIRYANDNEQTITETIVQAVLKELKSSARDEALICN